MTLNIRWKNWSYGERYNHDIVLVAPVADVVMNTLPEKRKAEGVWNCCGSPEEEEGVN